MSREVSFSSQEGGGGGGEGGDRVGRASLCTEAGSPLLAEHCGQSADGGDPRVRPGAVLGPAAALQLSARSAQGGRQERLPLCGFTCSPRSLLAFFRSNPPPERRLGHLRPLPGLVMLASP